MNVIPLKLRPLIRVERWTVGWMVTVRPCPDGVASCLNFDSEAEAATYAQGLQAEHGWSVRPDRYAVSLPGAA